MEDDTRVRVEPFILRCAKITGPDQEIVASLRKDGKQILLLPLSSETEKKLADCTEYKGLEPTPVTVRDIEVVCANHKLDLLVPFTPPAPACLRTGDEMRLPERPTPAFNPRPFPPSVVLLELFRASKQASDLYASADWQAVCADLSEESRAEVLKGLKATQAVVEAMTRSLEDTPTNYGIQR